MVTRKLSLTCPVCASADVFYSCTPNCCFNHVCAQCSTTFEPATTLAGGSAHGIVPPNPLPEATDPTVACAKCDSTQVYMTGQELLVCSACGCLLKLEITEIVPGTA
jgi:hypothetical protein